MAPSSVTGIILAAGKGTRMKSDLPKCVHPVCGKPMVLYIVEAMKAAGVARPIVVIGHGGEKLQEVLGDQVEFVWQHEQKGTGHAVLMAQGLLQDHSGPVLISAGDTPLVEAEVFCSLLDELECSEAVAVAATAVLQDPDGYGRIIRDAKGHVLRNVEQKDASPDELAVKEVNAAIYCIDGDVLMRYLPKLSPNNAQKEIYLTDILGAITGDGGVVTGKVFRDQDILLGVNDRWQLAEASSKLRKRILRRHVLNGVDFVDIDSSVIGPDVRIEAGAIIEPFTQILGDSTIGSGSRIGPNSRLTDVSVGTNCRLLFTVAEDAQIGDDVKIGPYAHIRPKTVIENHVRIGNFVELKNTRMHEGAKANHLAYLGDAQVGENSNIGAGTITCNYDGFEKHRTVIGSNTFIGSNSTLVAPLTIGDGAMVAAGSVITRAIPANGGAFGRARQETKEGWAAQWRTIKQSSKKSNSEA